MQWLINIIKEWVIAQAYATETWVLEWVTPLHVTGTLDPDSTCTYYKAGTFNSQPYYVRNDGAYYIWWNGTHLWLISEALGVAAQPLWGRNDPEILGNYAPVAPTAGTAAVASGYGCPHLCFVDRGDPAVNDKTQATLVMDGNWHDWDLSTIVPAGAKGVSIKITLFPLVLARPFELRKNGNVNVANTSYVVGQVVGVLYGADVIVSIDSNRIVEYRVIAGSYALITLTIKNWWF